MFGNYELIERCASEHSSPLDIRYRKIDAFDEQRIEGFFRAATAFVPSYLEATRGRSHSYAFARLLGSFESMTSPISTFDSMGESWHRSSAYAGLTHSIQFIAFVVENLYKLNIPPTSLREKKHGYLDPYDGLAQLFYKAALDAAFVTQPEFRCWDIQHNVVWRGKLKFYQRSKALSALQFKIRRKLYNEIREMDRFPNFVGARILGFCLNVLGLHPIDRRADHLHCSDYALQRVILSWTKRRFRWLAEEYPNLAAVCLQGFISYDKEGNRLIQANGNQIKKTPKSLVYLNLD